MPGRAHPAGAADTEAADRPKTQYPVSLFSPASRRGGSHCPTGRLGGKSVHYPTLRSRPIRTCQQEPNQCPGFRNQTCAPARASASLAAG